MKVTLRFIIALTVLGNAMRAQPVIYSEAPLYDNSTSTNRAPNGTINHAFMRACALVLQSELTAIPSGTTITSFGFTMNTGTGITNNPGTIILYLQNTNDIAYSKGTNFAAALTGMQQVYSGAMTIPASTGPTSVVVTLSTPFTYTGGGIYVAYDWSSTGPFDATPASFRCNSAGLVGGCATATAAINTSPPPTLMTTNFRPCFLWGMTNPYTNDMQVLAVDAPGTIPAMFSTPHIISAIVKNGSNTSLNNINVSLNVGGANPMTNVQVVSSLAAGATATVAFPAFNPVIPGLNTISVSVASDQQNNNNVSTYSQSVTCNVWSQNPAPASFTGNPVGFGVGGTGAGLLGSLYSNPVASTLTGISAAISTNTGNPGNPVYAALLSSAGVLIATTNTITITSGMLGTIQNFSFATPQALNGLTNYYLGLVQTANTSVGYFPAATLPSGYVPANAYVSTLPTGGATTPIPPIFGYFGIFGIFQPAITLSVTPQTVSCGNTATLNAVSSTNYSWSTGATISSIMVTPTINTTYTVTATNSLGCSVSKLTTVTVTPFPLTVTKSASIICKGDNVTITASGASSYSWSAGPNQTSASFVDSPSINTAYALTATNSAGCYNSTVVTVAVQSFSNMNVSITEQTLCIGGTVNVSASNAVTYTWNAGPQTLNTSSISTTPTVSSVYTVTGADNLGCLMSKTINIHVNSFKLVTSPDTAICLGSGYTLSATGGTFVSWNNIFTFPTWPVTPTVTTTYTVEGTGANGCSDSTQVTIIVNSNPTVSVSAVRKTMCRFELNVLNATGAATYTWTGGAAGQSLQINPQVLGQQNFTVTGIDAKGCSAQAKVTVTVSSCNGLADNSVESTIRIFPNPSSGIFYINSENDNVTIEVLNNLGQIILTAHTGVSGSVDLSDRTPGIYHIRVLENDHIIKTQLIIKN